jgi:hypothetical protein
MITQTPAKGTQLVSSRLWGNSRKSNSMPYKTEDNSFYYGKYKANYKAASAANFITAMEGGKVSNFLEKDDNDDSVDCEEDEDTADATDTNYELLVFYARKQGQRGGYDTDSHHPGWLKFHNIRDLLARFFIGIHVKHGKINNWREFCIGVTSQYPNSGQLPMFDFDGKNIKTRVKKDIKALQSSYKLGDATIYETKGGLHVYFFADQVSLKKYKEMLNTVNICKGFKEAVKRKGYATLRISAKYTQFDIVPYKVITSAERYRRRPGQKAAIIQEILRLGGECQTHIASLYPQWAYYTEDMVTWKVTGKSSKARRVRLISQEEMVAGLKVKNARISAAGLNNAFVMNNGDVAGLPPQKVPEPGMDTQGLNVSPTINVTTDSVGSSSAWFQEMIKDAEEKEEVAKEDLVTPWSIKYDNLKKKIF